MVTKPELEEKNFIHEGVKKDPFPLLYTFIALVLISTLFWGISKTYRSYMKEQFEHSPFLQVTNRDFSLFLWQNPEFMRVRMNDKAAYLPAFNYVETLSMDPLQASDYVAAPPDILYKYHTWKRLLGNEIPVRPVFSSDFLQFLDFAQEWSPLYWEEAPEDYRQLIQALKEKQDPTKTLTVPYQVQQAYTGWKNFFFEGNAINSFYPTYHGLYKLIEIYPHYARNYWQNLIPNYPETIFNSEIQDTLIPQEQIPSFLHSALFNFSRGV